MFESLAKFMEGPLSKQNFSLLGPVCERHGSWDWTFHKESGGLDRFITVSLINISFINLPNPSQYKMEIWIGAEQDNLFVRHFVNQFIFVEEALNSSQVAHKLKDLLSDAINLVEKLTPADLGEVGLPKRKSH